MTDTNSTELVYTRQTGFKQPLADPAKFRVMERSELSQFGETYTKSEPTRISRNRNPRQKRVTAKDSGVEFAANLDVDSMLEFGGAFLYGKATGPASMRVTGIAADTITVDPVSASVAATIQSGGATTIFALKGLRSVANQTTRGEFLLGAAVAAGATAITLTGLTAESIPANRRVDAYIAGVRGAAGDLAIDADGNLISTTLDLTTLGLVVDQAIYIGGTDDVNGFAEEDTHGFAQVQEIAANKITLYNRDRTYAADAGADTQIDILFGPYLRNYPIGDVNFERVFYTFGLSTEFTDPDVTKYEYAKDNACDSMSIALEDEFASVTFGFVGTETTRPSTIAQNGHTDAAPLNSTAEFATNVDLVQFAIKKDDGSNLMTDFDDFTLTIANGAAARKVRGTLVPSQINIGNLEVSAEYTAIFSNSDIIETIACDGELSLRFPIWNDDGGMYFHIPRLGLEGGDRSFPENESVTISTTGYAYNEDRDGACLAITVFPLLPKKPCAA